MPWQSIEQTSSQSTLSKRVPFGTTIQVYSASFSFLQSTSLQLLDRSRRGYQIDSCLVAFAEECRGNALIRLLPISSFKSTSNHYAFKYEFLSVSTQIHSARGGPIRDGLLGELFLAWAPVFTFFLLVRPRSGHYFFNSTTCYDPTSARPNHRIPSYTT